MRLVKIAAILVLVYVGIVAAFESLIGYFQPAGGSTLVITTSDADGAHDRVVSRLEVDGRLYVAANHWPRAWYQRALANPAVSVSYDDKKGDYTAVSVSGAEHDQVNGTHPLPAVFRVLTGFPPRYFLRLDPNPNPS